MNTIPSVPEKILNQLRELVKNQKIAFYSKESFIPIDLYYNRLSFYQDSEIYPKYDAIKKQYTDGKNVFNLLETPEKALTIVKYVREMTINDLFEKTLTKQIEFKNQFELELEIIELRKLKESVANIKTVIGKI